MITVTVTTSGPAFDERAQRILDDYTDEAVWAITKVGRGDLGVDFIRHFREPTGYYESQVQAVRGARHTFTAHIHDNGVVYGPWLEGISSRNFPVTRFRGYASFRRIAAQLQQKAVPIAESVLPPFLARLNGGA
jgi:hypothetical protein